VRIGNALDRNRGNCGINRIASCPEYIQARKRRGWMGCGDLRQVHHRAFEGHPEGERLKLLHRRVRMEADAAPW
jgi:hypothetical protein